MNITFKKLFSSAAICAALAMSNAHAANDVTLKVIGNIVLVPAYPHCQTVEW